jgi:hypothetical protein
MERPPSAPRPASPRAGLYLEVERLTAEFLERAPAAEAPEIERFVRQREELLERIQAAPEGPAAEAESSAAAIRRMLDLDRELLVLLEARKADVRRQLAEVGQRRQPLGVYRGPNPDTSTYLDRTG